MQMDSTERCGIEHGLNQISTIASALDKIISGKALDPVAVVAPSLVDKFREFVSKQTIMSPRLGAIQAEWRPWYKREFERLSADKEGPTIFQEVSFSRQDGVTTFLVLYSAFMAIQRGRKILILAGSPEDKRHFERRIEDIYAKIEASAGGTVRAATGLGDIRGNSYDQVIGDNSPLTFTNRGRFTETAIALIPGRSDMDTPWVLYHTVE